MSTKNTATTTTAGTATKASVPEKKKQSNVMYLGPTITGVVRHSTVFKDGVLPKKVKECIEKLPVMEKLFVATGDIPKAVKELKKDQSVLGTIYAQTANKFK